MSARGKIDMQTLVKDTIKEIFANEEFMNQITKTISDNIEQKLQSLQETVNIQTQKISEMEQKIDELKQQEKINNICIYGIPEFDKDDEKDLTSRVVDVLNKQTVLDLKNENIIAIYRVGNKRDDQNKARPIIVRLINHSYKVLLLKNARSLKGKHIFISEDLTKRRRELLSEAKSTFGKTNAWSFNGQIYIKSNNQATRIRNANDILEHK